MTQARVVAGEDIQKAFDSMAHLATLEKLAVTKPGERMLNYMKDLLTYRTTAIKMADYISPKHKLQLDRPARSNFFTDHFQPRLKKNYRVNSTGYKT